MQENFGVGSTEHAKSVYKSIPLGDAVPGFELGAYNTYGLFNDPKRFGFLFARYKFAAKMLHGCGSILEIGCQ